MNGCVCKWMDGWVGVLMGGCVKRWMDGWVGVGGWMC